MSKSRTRLRCRHIYPAGKRRTGDQCKKCGHRYVEPAKPKAQDGDDALD